VIELLAHAKLTWNLEITGVRDDGLHELRSEMTTIALHDVLFVDDTTDHLEILNPFATEIVSDENNLIVRACSSWDVAPGCAWRSPSRSAAASAAGAPTRRPSFAGRGSVQ